MLDALVGALGAILLLLGLVVTTVGLYGLLRRQEIFGQLHAAGLVTGPGVILVLLASVGTGHAESITSAVLVVAFVLVTSSLSTHAIALAAWRRREGADTGTGSPDGDVRAAPTAALSSSDRVLVAHDGSPGADVAARLVAGIAWPAGTRVRVVVAMEGELAPLDPARAPGGQDGREGGDTVVDGAVRLLSDAGLEVDRVVGRGLAAGAIADAAVAFGAALVVVGSRGLGRVRSAIAGSVAAGVVDAAPCPVLVARSPRLREVVLATDGSAAADAAVELVATWPAFSGSRIRVVSVASVGPRYAGTLEPIRERVARARQQRIADAAALRLREAGRNALPAVVAGAAADRIVDLAEREDVDLIVLGSRGRTGARRSLLGSVASEVLASSSCSVLIVRAPGRR